MTLEDFFTLTEMKDGLTSPARVKELVNVMQKERDYIVKNVGDATRQWSTVAGTIAATEDKDCLDLFVQLEGLWFIDRWLKDAQKFGNDTSESFVEESITALLRALEKLRIDCEKSVSSGVWMTVKDLLGHTSSTVQDRARAVFDSWKQDGDSETAPQDFQTVGNEEKHVEPQKDEMLPSTCSGNFQPEKVDDCQSETSNKKSSLDHEVLKEEGSSYPVGSIVLEPVKENSSVEEESPSHHLEGTASVETSRSVAPKQEIEVKSDVPDSKEYNDEAKKIPKITSPLNKLGPMETSSVSLSGDDVTANAQGSVTDSDLENNVDTKDKGCPKVSPVGEAEAELSEGKCRRDDAGSPHHHCSSTAVLQSQGQDCDTDALLEFASNEGKLKKLEDPQASFSSECSGATDEVKEHDSDESDDLAFETNYPRPAMDVIRSDVIVDKSRSDLELDDVMVDALELARQVAIEVEREVVDRSREPSCSGSSEKSSKIGGIGQPDSPECVYGKEIQPLDASSKKEAPTGPDPSAVASPNGVDLSSSAKTLDAETEEQNQDIDSYEAASAAAQKQPEVDVEKGFSDFDLNQELCSEDTMDRPINPNSTTISVVSASRAAAAPGFPISPLQFDGAHGWKGSAATSAFRRILEDGKTRVADGTQNISKQRQDWQLDFDLNVAEAGDDNKPADQIQFKHTQIASSGLPFGESSLDASTKRHERLFNLDLNHISDDGDAPSPSSSSSTMQPAVRNIDLNDQPSFHNDSSSDPVQPFFLGKSSLQNLNASGGGRSHDSAISILGTRVEVNRIPQTPPLQNGRNVNPNLDFSLGNSGGVLGMGSAFPYTGPPVFGYNGLTTGPAVTFSSAMYGQHYMVDSRGATVVPQVLGSASPAGYSHPQFVLGMMETPPGSNGAGPSRSHFDLNSGLMFEGGNRESSSGSGGVGKRKEPDGGWEHYPFNYKHQQPPWK